MTTELKIPTIVLPSIDEIPTRTWLIIIFVLVMFLLSCMSNRCSPQETFVSLNPEDFGEYEGFSGYEGFDDAKGEKAVDTLDAGQGFAPKPAYSCSLQSRCLPGERDIGGFCVKEGCPPGTQRGVGLGLDFCYPKCIMGYENDGASRCYKKCPEGWSTQGDKCVRPKHEFKKDVIPCKGCLPPTPSPVPDIPIVAVDEGPVVMTPGTSAFVLPTYQATTVTHPSLHVHNGKNPKPHVHPRTTTQLGLVGGTLMVEPFGDSYSSKPDLMEENFENSRVDATQTNVIPPKNSPQAQTQAQFQKASVNSITKPLTKPKKAVWRVEDRISVDELPCPLGYTLSGDKCYENCPPHYRDTGNGCTLDRYAVERPSYDRGSGIPYASKRSKSLKVHPIDRSCG